MAGEEYSQVINEGDKKVYMDGHQSNISKMVHEGYARVYITVMISGQTRMLLMHLRKYDGICDFVSRLVSLVYGKDAPDLHSGLICDFVDNISGEVRPIYAMDNWEDFSPHVIHAYPHEYTRSSGLPVNIYVYSDCNGCTREGFVISQLQSFSELCSSFEEKNIDLSVVNWSNGDKGALYVLGDHDKYRFSIWKNAVSRIAVRTLAYDSQVISKAADKKELMKGRQLAEEGYSQVINEADREFMEGQLEICRRLRGYPV